MTEKKKINRSAKHKLYEHLLNSKEWRELRAWKIQQCQGLCERCKREGIEAGVQGGYLTPAKTVHHIIPVESVPDNKMKDVCFDKNNLILLCPNCHHRTHEEMKSHQWQVMRTIPKEEQKMNEHMKEWAARHGDPNYQPTPKPRKGIRKTRFGWVTKEEYKQKQQELFDKWKERNDGPKDITRPTSVDTSTKD